MPKKIIINSEFVFKLSSGAKHNVKFLEWSGFITRQKVHPLVWKLIDNKSNNNGVACGNMVYNMLMQSHIQCHLQDFPMMWFW